MAIKIEFQFDDKGDAATLQRLFDCTAAQLPAKLSQHADAALHEYVESYMGRRAFSRGSDILEHRLSLLIRHAFGNVMPTAAQISDLFQTTLATSRSIIRNTFSKYRYDLDTAASASAKHVLEHIDWSGQDARAIIREPNLLELLNRRLLNKDPKLKEVARIPGIVGTYAIHEDTYAVLCTAFGATPKPHP
jgi:hypothetical protein